jgi:hypothetical protein
MPENGRKVRYRRQLDTLNSLQRDVRELTSEIRSARQELLDELPARRRADIRHRERLIGSSHDRAADHPEGPRRKKRP